MNNRSFYKTLIYSFLTGIFIISIHTLINGNSEDEVRLVIRLTARLAAFLFSIIFVASSIHYFVDSPLSAGLIKLRPHIALIFVVVHTLHLISLFFLQYQIHPVFTLAKTSSLLGGGIAFAFIYFMAFTTFPEIKKGWANENGESCIYQDCIGYGLFFLIHILKK